MFSMSSGGGSTYDPLSARRILVANFPICRDLFLQMALLCAPPFPGDSEEGLVLPISGDQLAFSLECRAMSLRSLLSLKVYIATRLILLN